MDIREKIKNPPKKYRPIPFWSWNERLDVEETKRQIAMMDENGMGGYFMHARGGLETDYMGEEWFDNTTVGVEEGLKRGMGGWAYDENGWPSGFASGAVNGLGEEYWQKYLRVEPGEGHTDRTIANVGGYHFYYDVNEFYVDNLDKKVVVEFIDKAYKPYCEKYKGKMPGIFTDEPQVSRNGIPWSLVLPDAYKAEYNDDLLAHLPELFYEMDDYKITRFRFWKLVEKLFTDAFAKQIYEFIDSYGMKLTGHMVLEETLCSQITSNGAVMPNYEYFHIPGVDWLTRNKPDRLISMQVSSVAQQLGKEQILTESFALCGHNVSFEELRWILETQYVRGINLLCPHLQGYSLRGIRKRDYPPAMYYQQPWWKEYGTFIERMTRIGVMLTEGKAQFDTLLLHPQSTAWTLFDNNENKGLKEMNEQFDKIMEAIERKHIPFHLGDERIMERHARVEGAAIVIGSQKYTNIIIPYGEFLFDSTKALLEEFKANGGKIVTVEELEANKLCSNENLVYTCRHFADFDMHYFVNETRTGQWAEFNCGNKYLDIDTGDFKAFSGECTLAPLSSIVIIDDKSEGYAPAVKDDKKILPLDGLWKVEKSDLNALTLDYCDYWIDGELIEKNAYILDVGDRANALERKAQVKVRYEFDTDFVPDEIYMAVETPVIFDIEVNGKKYEKKDCGYFRDAAFRKLDLSGYVQQGKNEIVMTCDFEQSPEVYKAIKDSRIFESEKNKLRYDMEIEGIFIVGDFDVISENEQKCLERNAYRIKKGFRIVGKKSEITLKNIDRQGYQFFSGALSVSKKINLDSKDYKLKFSKHGINAVHVKVNGKEAGSLIWNPYELDLSDYLKVGENEIELTIVNNLRNLMGPHHQEEGECFKVGPAQFYKNMSPFYMAVPWNDDYCFVETTIE